MRRVIVNNIVSLDGYFADETGNPLALTRDATNGAISRHDNRLPRSSSATAARSP